MERVASEPLLGLPLGCDRECRQLRRAIEFEREGELGRSVLGRWHWLLWLLEVEGSRSIARRFGATWPVDPGAAER